jgi:hypothetical protein
MHCPEMRKRMIFAQMASFGLAGDAHRNFKKKCGIKLSFTTPGARR